VSELNLVRRHCLLVVFCVSLVSGGISAFGPLIIRGFGFDAFNTILYNMIPGAIGIAANIMCVGTPSVVGVQLMFSAAYCAQRFKVKGPVILGILIFPVAAAAALFALPRGPAYTNRLLAVYFILQIFQPLTPLIFSWT
jgi:hypothetical protein